MNEVSQVHKRTDIRSQGQRSVSKGHLSLKIFHMYAYPTVTEGYNYQQGIWEYKELD